MVVFEIIWNIIGILFGVLGLLLGSVLVFLAMAIVASLGDRGSDYKKKGTDNGRKKK